MVEMKFNSCKIFHNTVIKKFAFHMDKFIIPALILNILNIAIHYNTIFIVISYNQNLHFKMHCKKLKKQDYNSFHHILILHKIHTTI
jgi:hypothetical protein